MDKEVKILIDLTKSENDPNKYCLIVGDDLLPRIIYLSKDKLISIREGIDKILAVKA